MTDQQKKPTDDGSKSKTNPDVDRTEERTSEKTTERTTERERTDREADEDEPERTR